MDTNIEPPSVRDQLLAPFLRQRAAFLRDPYPSLALRQDRLSRAIAMIAKAKPDIIEVINADFGGRAQAISLIADVLSPMTALKDAKRRVKSWMRPERRSPEFPMGLLGVKAWVEFQPLGVIGVMSPWNAPVALSFQPLAGILAAGNRAMIKPSELTPNVSALIARIVAANFDPDEITVIEGDVETARAFTTLPFDHLLFTGGGGAARHVMRAAADNLTPVTLELGGKSPAVVASDADIADAAAKILGGKLSNAGQICMCPDHAWVPADQIDAFVIAAQTAVKKMFPTLAGNPDATAIVGERSQTRLKAAIEEARAGGATIIELSTPDPARPNVLVPMLVVNPPENSVLARQEVFGPILPVRSYTNLPDLIARLNDGPTPLAFYFFGSRPEDIALVREKMRAGGMTIGDVMLHPFMQDLPFGGLGESGMSRYVGHDGFKTFSHQKSTVRRGWLDIGKYLQPPYTPLTLKLLNFATRK
jgi:coniferyl-aldehyde dehydrogenase